MASPEASDIRENKTKSQYLLSPSFRKHTPQLLQYSIGYTNQPFSLFKVTIQEHWGSSHQRLLEAILGAADHNFFKNLWAHRRCINSQFWRFKFWWNSFISEDESYIPKEEGMRTWAQVFWDRLLHLTKWRPVGLSASQIHSLLWHCPNFIRNFLIEKVGVCRLQCKLRHSLEPPNILGGAHI